MDCSGQVLERVIRSSEDRINLFDTRGRIFGKNKNFSEIPFDVWLLNELL
ncbi:hypothetical protein LEP1GSC071_1826 [Leptospira santarosai str. JET]|nr:hypothetical protein LEP1GSC071_1826 [Leptospira santarosai str. JET]EMO83890.1 hypothetical protein LEP1GSC070_0619 [Leptospira santarosai str. AIM]